MIVEQLDIGYARPTPSTVEELAHKLGCNWAHLRLARDRAEELRQALRKGLAEFSSSDASVVVFGSLARDEVTPGSDVDWTLLVDGMADPAHADVALAIKRKLQSLGVKSPGREGTFGTLAFSHEIIHQIGGQD